MLSGENILKSYKKGLVSTLVIASILLTEMPDHTKVSLSQGTNNMILKQMFHTDKTLFCGGNREEALNFPNMPSHQINTSIKRGYGMTKTTDMAMGMLGMSPQSMVLLDALVRTWKLRWFILQQGSHYLHFRKTNYG